jgi:hypothetical protein
MHVVSRPHILYNSSEKWRCFQSPVLIRIVKTFYHGTLPRIFFRTGHHQRAIVFSNYLRKLSAARLLAYANLLQREKRKWTKKT